MFGGPVRDVKIVKLHRDVTKHYYLVAVTDSDRYLKLIGFEAGSKYIWRRADARTTGPAFGFDLDAMNGIVLTAFQDREKELRITTWDATYVPERIRRLDDWEGGRVYRVTAAYLRQIDGYYRFVTVLSDSKRKHRIIVWDVEPDTGRIHRRGHAVGGTVGEVSVALLHDNVVDLSAPMLVVSSVTDGENNLWTRIWKIDRAGNVSPGAGIGAGRAYQVGIARVTSSVILVSVREGAGRLKMIAYKVQSKGNTIDRMGDHLLPNTVGVIVACRTNSMGSFNAVQDHFSRLSMLKWGVFGEGRDIRLDARSKPQGGEADRVSCAGNATLVVAAFRDAEDTLWGANRLVVMPFIP